MPSLVRDHVSFLQNDAILPAQYWYGGRNPSGCQKLLMAILDEVLVTLRATAAMRRHKADSLWNDAVAWVADEEDRYGSFVYCCHYLNLEPARVRAVLRAHYGLERRVPSRQPYVRLGERVRRGKNSCLLRSGSFRTSSIPLAMTPPR